ncbi:MAG: hypothetical protein AB8B56_18030 [Crocinitomicaceae bacterium]
MKKVIFSLTSTCLMFLGHAQVTSTFQSDNTSAKQAITTDASPALCAISVSANVGHSVLPESTANESTDATNGLKNSFEKTIFVEVNFNDDSVLFKPFSKVWGKQWIISSDMTYQGSALMNSEKYERSFNGRTENLWTILHPKVIDGTFHSYYPYDPAMYGLGNWDGWELQYPLLEENESGTFLSSESTRENQCFLLGQFGPRTQVPLINQYGEDSVKVMADGSQEPVYEAPDYNWYTDKDIVKYKLRVSIRLNKNGKEKKRIIKAIAPVVHQLSETGDVHGEQELFWMDFEELESFLKKSYYFDENLKSVSYLDYFSEKVKNAPVKSND